MKKIIFIIFLGCIAIFLQSCTQTCICIDRNNKVREIEIDPTEQCSERSGETLGDCS
jgi:hypothetical protein